MDFTLALTHFCEVHGPKSVLCTQVLPLECVICLPSPRLRQQSSSDSLETRIDESAGDENPEYMTHSMYSARTTGTTNTLPTDFSAGSTAIDSEPDSPDVEQPRLHKTEDQSKSIDPQFKYGRAQGDTCSSCSFTVPQSIANQLPKGAPGSLRADDKTKHTAPVLRSREVVCLGRNEIERKRPAHVEQSSSHESNNSSLQSGLSRHSHSDCHDHTLTYLTTKSPDNPDIYAQLRGSVIRTLSFEQLPKGTSDGPLYFGDDEAGYTIAYVFRLTDPKARGRIRAYAFVALAGKNASRALKTCPMLWEAFAAMAKRIEQTAQRYQDEQRKKEDKVEEKKSYTPVASFLTQRAVDPDGHPRRSGQIMPRSLADIIGDENIFAILHQYFVAVLQCLGNRFGGLPLASEESAYQSLAEERSQKTAKTNAATVTKFQEHLHALPDDIAQVKQKNNKQGQQNPQCGPLTIDTTVIGQVVM